ncbi:MAG: sulfatase [Planctomycetota bacterium]
MHSCNIITIVVDDLGWADLGCFGSSFYETPNIDHLAKMGTRFTDAYASCPVCSPTRASLLTGQYPARIGLTQFIGGHLVGHLQDVPYFNRLPLQLRTLPEALRDGGYQTWHVGKWHLGEGTSLPDRRGFDINLGGCGWGLPKHGYFSPYGCPTLSDGPDGEYLTDRLTDESLRLIDERDTARPFFLNLCHYAVHTPLQAPAPLVEKYRAKADRLGLDPYPLAPPEAHPCYGHRHEVYEIRRRRYQSHPIYAAMIEALDSSIGRLVGHLAQRDLLEQTMIIVTSDNGGLATTEGSPTCNAPLSEGKGWMYEGGNRISQIISWPGHLPVNRTCSIPTTTTDIYPTCLDAAGLPLEPHHHRDGVSLLPILRPPTNDPQQLDRDAIFWHYPHYSNQGGAPAAAVRHGDHKLIEHFEDGRLELFDLRQDPGEHDDLSMREPQLRKRLRCTAGSWTGSGSSPHRSPRSIPTGDRWRTIPAAIPRRCSCAPSTSRDRCPPAACRGKEPDGCRSSPRLTSLTHLRPRSAAHCQHRIPA